MKVGVVLILTFGLVQPALAAEPRYTFANFTGSSGGAGSDDGEGATARFYSPIGIATDADGNLYVADLNNGTVRKVTPSGYTTTLAGLAGAIGKTNGLGAAALFNGPAGTAVDSKGNVYLADAGNHQIRKITPAGVVSVFAGGSSSGAADGNGTKAFFTFPADVAVDSADNVYVADGGNNTIRKITPSGDVTTLAGSAPVRGFKDGVGKVAQFSVPQGVACDKDGNVYVADTGNESIRKITPAGVVSTFAGHAGPGHDDGTGAAASFNLPYGVAVGPSGNIYVADTDNNLIRKITPDGAVTTIAGGTEFSNSGSTDGTGTSARFAAPYDIAADGAGNLYVAEGNNNVVRKVTTNGVVTTLAGRARALGPRDGALSEALFQDMAADTLGNLYVIDDRLIRKISPTGVVSTVAGGPWDALNPYIDGAASAARFQTPLGLAVDRAGNVYVAEANAHTIRRIAPNGTVSTIAGKRNQLGHTDGAGAQAQFAYPVDVAVDRDGAVYVAEDCTIRKIGTDGVVSSVVGKPGSFSGCTDNVDGPFAAARLNGPNNLVIDAAGNLYVTTKQSLTANTSVANNVRKISLASGVVTTLAGGTYKQQTYRDGRSGLAYFIGIGDLAVDTAGNVFATETLAKTVRRVTPDGLVTTIGGFPGEIGTAEATALDARFNAPDAIAFDSAGTLFVAEDHGIRVARPALSDSATIDDIFAVVGGRRQLGTTTHNASSLKWSFVRQPSASTAALSSTTIAEPTFTPDVADLFELRLTASDSVSTSVTDVLLLAAAGTATPSGNNVKVSGTNVSLTFPSVTSAGQTLIAVLPGSVSEPLPDATKVPQAVYEVTTTAGFTPPARFCVALTASDLSHYVIYHREGTALVDRTSTRDAATKTICADAQTLGRFVVAAPAGKRRPVVP